MSEGVLAVDATGKVILANPAIARLFGERAKLARRLDGGGSLARRSCGPTFKQVFSRRERHHRWSSRLNDRILSLNIAPLSDQRDGRSSGAVGILHDISERYRLEKMRRDFLADVSHELKTPLTSIRGFAQAILEGVVTDGDQVRRYLQVIMDESVRLTRLVNTLLDLSRIESNAVALQFEDVDLARSLESAVERLDPLHSERDVEVEAGHSAPSSRQGRPRPAGAGLAQPAGKCDPPLAARAASSVARSVGQDAGRPGGRRRGRRGRRDPRGGAPLHLGTLLQSGQVPPLHPGSRHRPWACHRQRAGGGHTRPR